MWPHRLIYWKFFKVDAVVRSKSFLCDVPSRMVKHLQGQDVVPGTPSDRKCHKNYEEAISALNSLQSNAVVLERSRKNPKEAALNSFVLTIKYLARTGISVNKLNKLKAIHVSGTKGKGSTCAFCESILRQYGYKTGFYSSPHIIAVRERIRINGQPLKEQDFARYFWEVYNKLFEKKTAADDMPPYFKFLTIMAFFVFLKEQVDVAIIEVGVGGEYDCTNVIRKPVVCGVSSLGYDHTHILGTSISEIAWQKGGIFKPNVPAFSVSQDEAAMKVLQSRAKEIGCPLMFVRSIESHNWHDHQLVLGLAGKVQRINASLAVQLVNCWLKTNNSLGPCSNGKDVQPTLTDSASSIAPTLTISIEIAKGLRHCFWPGRHQVFCKGNICYFLDGAHTPESITTCLEWFIEASNEDLANNPSVVKRVLIFNSTGMRSNESLLMPLATCEFDHVIFCPNTVSNNSNSLKDLINMSASEDELLKTCEKNKKTWLKLVTTRNGVNSDQVSTNISIFRCIKDTLGCISSSFGQNGFADLTKSHRLHILATGSLHLIGGILSILDPQLTCGKTKSI